MWRKLVVWTRVDVPPPPQQRFVGRVEDDVVTRAGK
jgi:hypothetical protein